jgi:hypothetical protein
MCFDKNLTIVYEKVIKPILEIHRFRCIRADEMTNIGKITEQVEEMIEKSDLIVCDLSYNSPNVFFELGIAHSHNKIIIHITQEPSNIPFDIMHNRMIPYQDTKTGLLDLRDNLSKFITNLFPNSENYSKLKSKIKYITTNDDIEEQRFAMSSSISHIMHYAIKFLGDCADIESFDTIKRTSEIEKNPDILRDAFVALYKIDSAKAKETLIEYGLKKQKEYLVRERVVQIIGNYNPEIEIELVNQLIEQSRDTSWGVRRAVCEVFGKWGIGNKDIIAKLKLLLNDEEQFVRFSAKEALEKISEKEKGKRVRKQTTK